LLAPPVPQLTDNLRGVFRRRKGIRVRQRIRRLELWPVFKLAVAFHAICGAITLGVLILLWNLGTRAGFTDRFSKFLVDIRLADSVKISGPTVLRGATTVVVAIAILNAVTTVLLAVLYNLLSGLLGGLIVSVVEDDSVRVSKPSARANSGAIRSVQPKEKLDRPPKAPKAERATSKSSQPKGPPNNPARAGLGLPDDELDDTDWLTDMTTDNQDRSDNPGDPGDRQVQ
jgi:hypothetical protein